MMIILYTRPYVHPENDKLRQLAQARSQTLIPAFVPLPPCFAADARARARAQTHRVPCVLLLLIGHTQTELLLLLLCGYVFAYMNQAAYTDLEDWALSVFLIACIVLFFGLFFYLSVR